MSEHPRTLQRYLIKYMADSGRKQTEIAKDSGLSISDVNGIVQGRIKLPGPGKRRGLASALGVSHLDLLVAAGEINEDELGGVAGVVEYAPDDPRQKIRDLIERVPDRDRLEGVADMLSRWVYGESAPSPSAPSDTR